jgi:thiosulfate/3-mercaptopyruvate sulfurtransferase
MHRVGLALLISAFAFAQGSSPLIQTDWLAAHLNDPGLVILHAGTAKDYEAGHISGARLIEISAISQSGPGGLRVEMPAESALRQALESLGVSNRSRVVVYAGTNSPVYATRVWFTLDALGLGSRALLLDGGLPAWREAGHPVTAEVPAPARGELQTSLQQERFVSADWIKERLGNAQAAVLDARLPQYHSGADAGSMPRAGRIPGARNVPYPTLFDKDGRYLPPAELRRRIEVDGAKTYAVYCHIGVSATTIYFAARLLGLDVKLYDGSFQEWSGRAELPVETTPK